jgi:hypothetical protein
MLAVAACVFALPMPSFANAVLTAVRGDVKAGPSVQALMQARENQSLSGGTTVTTGENSEATLQFEDGQRVTLGQNTEFRIVDYRYDRSLARNDRAIFDMLKGALRVVTGAIAQRNRIAWSLRTPNVTIGVRGTDFAVVHVNPTYLTVLQGVVTAANSAGTVAFGAGAISSIASSTTLPAAISASALPATASTALAGLGPVPAGGVGGVAVGAAAAGGVAATTVSTTTMVAIGAAVAGIAVIAQDDKPATTTHH